jgi:type VI secretion system protein ImpF
LAQQENLQPSLLDRLSDDYPQTQQESRERRIISLTRLREAVLRDLGCLLNTDSLSSAVDLSDHPEVARSVLNFGMPALSGLAVSGADLGDLERRVKEAVCNFEPRILPRTVRVKVIVTPEEMNGNAMSFSIEGQLWAEPAPLHLVLRTDVDLEKGNVTVVESEAG